MDLPLLSHPFRQDRHRNGDAVTGLRGANPWLLWLLPLGGVAIVLLYRVCGMEGDRGTNFVLVAVREDQPLRLRTAPLVFAATMLTHLCGGSSGREGAILQIGGSISSKIGRWMGLDDKDRRVITMCGMSAAFSALFGTPLTAARSQTLSTPVTDRTNSEGVKFPFASCSSRAV